MSPAVAVVALDPGRNIGMAWLDSAGNLLEGRVTDLEGLKEFTLPAGAVLVLGDGTGSADLLSQLAVLGLQAELIDESDSSLEGSELYWRQRPLKGLLRLLPAGLRPRPPDLDAWAAYALGLRWLARHEKGPALKVPGPEDSG